MSGNHLEHRPVRYDDEYTQIYSHEDRQEPCDPIEHLRDQNTGVMIHMRRYDSPKYGRQANHYHENAKRQRDIATPGGHVWTRIHRADHAGEK